MSDETQSGRSVMAEAMNRAGAKISEMQAEFEAQQAADPPDEPTETEQQATGAAPEAPAAAPDASVPAETQDEGASGEVVLTQGEDGRWHRPDGTFASAEEVAAIESQAAPDADSAATAAAAVSIPAVRDGQQPVDIEIDDPDVAERLRFLANNGMRREEFNRRAAALESKEREYREFQTILRAAPERVVDRMTPEIRQRTLHYLLAQDFELAKPVVERWYNDDVARREALLGYREQVSQSDAEVQQAIQAERQAAEIMAGVRALVPPHATVEDEQDFLRDAEAALIAAANAGQAITKDSVSELLARHIRRYGFDANGRSVVPQPAQGSDPSVVARPIGDAAQKIAQAKRVQARRKQAIVQRQAAVASAPAGTGAVPAARPKPPVGQGFDKIGLWLKQNAHHYSNSPD